MCGCLQNCRAALFSVSLMGPFKDKGLVLNSVAQWEGAGGDFWLWEIKMLWYTGICKKPFREGYCKLHLLGTRSQKNQGGSMKEQSAWGSESAAQVCYEPRRPKLIKLESLNKSQRINIFQIELKFHFVLKLQQEYVSLWRSWRIL